MANARKSGQSAQKLLPVLTARRGRALLKQSGQSEAAGLAGGKGLRFAQDDKMWEMTTFYSRLHHPNTSPLLPLLPRRHHLHRLPEPLPPRLLLFRPFNPPHVLALVRVAELVEPFAGAGHHEQRLGKIGG